MTKEDIKDFYNKNKDFKDYIDRFCRTGRFTKEEALKKKVSHNVAEYYKEVANNG